MKRKAMQITLPIVINEFLHELMEEMGLNKSVLLQEMVFYISMPEHLEDFKSQFTFEAEGEDEDEEDEEDEEGDENEDEDEGEDERGLFDRFLAYLRSDEDEEEE